MRRSRLFRRYAVFFVALVGGALLVSAFLDLYFSYRENKAALVRLEREKAEAAASRIDQFIRTIEDQIGWMTQALSRRQGTSLERQSFDYLLRQAPSITEVSYLDGAGRERLRISRLGMDVVGSQVDYSTEPKFLEAKSGKTFFGPVYFRQESEPYMTIALSGKGQDAGVTVAEVNLKFIRDVVFQIKVGKAGRAYVLDSRGNLIAHPDMNLVLKKTSFASLPQVKDAMTGSPMPDDARDQATIARDLQGRQVLTASATILPLGWLVFVEEPLAEAFAPLYSSLIRIGILLLVGLGVSVMASVLLARKMVNPIRALQARAARIGAGALDERIEIRTGDELEALADQFNSMAGQLRDSYANLEQKVEALQESEATARALLDAPHEVVILLDTEGVILDANEATALGFHKTRDELIGLCIWDLLGPEAATRRKAFADRVIRSGEPIQFEDESEGKWWDSINYPIRDLTGKVSKVAVFARDITERKLAETRFAEYREQLRSLASELSLTEERERRRLAVYLHDQIGHTLALTNIRVGELQKRGPSRLPGFLREELEKIGSLLGQAIRDTRLLTFKISPPILHELGLEAALEWLCEQVQTEHGLRVCFVAEGQHDSLREDLRVLLFQAVNELLVNVVKHAKAHNLEVSLRREGGNLKVEVGDDGVGFEVPKADGRRPERGGFGLFSIRERLWPVGGRLDVQSAPGAGTHVSLSVPLADDSLRGEPHAH
jgi:PAS domain S-box-containing protein